MVYPSVSQVLPMLKCIGIGQIRSQGLLFTFSILPLGLWET